MDASTAAQIDALALQTHRPLLICDVDEVLVRFIDAFTDWLRRRGLVLHNASWSLEGNIRTPDGVALAAAEVRHLLDVFFAQCTEHLPLMDGAAEALAQLARQGVQVVLLTNLPHPWRPARRRNLLRHGLDFPLVSNTGPKGPAVRALRRKVRQQVAFVDDHPDFLHSAAEHCAPPLGVHLVHFVADNPFVVHLPDMRAPHVRVRNWREAGMALHRLLVLPALKQHREVRT